MMPRAPDPQTAHKRMVLSPADAGTSTELGFVERVRPRPNGPRVLAAAGGLLLLVVAAAVVLAVLGHSSKLPARAKQATPAATAPAVASATAPAATAQPSSAGAETIGTSTGTSLPAQTTSQLASLDSILNLAEIGRQSLANGDMTAAIANRSKVLQELGALHPDSELSASVRALQAAEIYSLHADTTCGLSCSASIDARATHLKQGFLAIFNPVATRHNTRTYTAGEV